MRKVILDTDNLSEVFKQADSVVIARAKDYLRVHAALTSTCVSLVEILPGHYAKDAKNQIACAEAFLRRHDQIAPDENDHALAAQIIVSLFVRAVRLVATIL